MQIKCRPKHTALGKDQRQATSHTHNTHKRVLARALSSDPFSGSLDHATPSTLVQFAAKSDEHQSLRGDPSARTLAYATATMHGHEVIHLAPEVRNRPCTARLAPEA
eukprot:6471429-Amphidinium_carterae.2